MFAIVVSVWWIEKVNVGALEYSRFLFAMDKGWTQWVYSINLSLWMIWQIYLPNVFTFRLHLFVIFLLFLSNAHGFKGNVFFFLAKDFKLWELFFYKFSILSNSQLELIQMPTTGGANLQINLSHLVQSSLLCQRSLWLGFCLKKWALVYSLTDPWKGWTCSNLLKVVFPAGMNQCPMPRPLQAALF